MGVITTKSPTGTEWLSRIALWPDKAATAVPPQDCNIDAVQLIPVSGQPDVYTLSMPKGVRQFFLEFSQENTIYQFANDERITRLEIVLRNADGSKDGRMTGSSSKNISVPIYNDGLNVLFTEPDKDLFIAKNQIVGFIAMASQTCDMQLLVGTNIVSSVNNTTTITGSHQFANSGTYTVKVNANNSNGSSSQSLHVTVRGDVVTQPKPSGVRYGINYVDDNTVTLVLFAPGKEFIYVVGDFNDWILDNNYIMKKY
ncbi:MAG: hypothetical protein RBR74_11125, partial [Ignavibacteriaceae bacterium]|nr:hypothetical protein [Ignavibacteriaceae bacterium]